MLQQELLLPLSSSATADIEKLEQFFTSIRKGEFKIPVCKNCKKKLWPPCQYCSSCFSRTELKKTTRKGILVEFSTSHLENRQVTFGVIEISGIRIIGHLATCCEPLRHGMKVTMTECGINNSGAIFYNFEVQA